MNFYFIISLYFITCKCPVHILFFLVVALVASALWLHCVFILPCNLYCTVLFYANICLIKQTDFNVKTMQMIGAQTTFVS